jgi:hypothetical protein
MNSDMSYLIVDVDFYPEAQTDDTENISKLAFVS